MNRIALIKLQPNQDIYEGLERGCWEAGIRRALILSGVGSVNDAWFSMPSKDVASPPYCIAGPGLEMAGVGGEVSVDEYGKGRSSLTGWITRQDGSVYGGQLTRARNIVCITFEFTVFQWTECPA